jgi:large subunit ribosomal protein L30
MAYAVIRVRGQPDVNYDIEYTMKLLGINRVNHCAIIPENDVTKGMLQKIKDYTTYGEIDEATLAQLIRVRGRLEGGKKMRRTDVQLSTDSPKTQKLE